MPNLQFTGFFISVFFQPRPAPRDVHTDAGDGELEALQPQQPDSE